jgi:hypothetical protein
MKKGTGFVCLLTLCLGIKPFQQCDDDWVTARTNTDVEAALNVGATNIDDEIAVFQSAESPGSNFGEVCTLIWVFRNLHRYDDISLQCVDIYAGGFNILTSGPGKSVRISHSIIFELSTMSTAKTCSWNKSRGAAGRRHNSRNY